jgi:hypothetical protein
MAWIIAAPMTIVATIAIPVRNLVNAASISGHLLSWSEASVRSGLNRPITVSKRLANAGVGDTGGADQVRAA